MSKPTRISLCLFPVLLASPALRAQPVPTASAAKPAPETTLDACRDGSDNDADGHTDCADQDCEIYAICLKQDAPPAAAPTAPQGPAEAGDACSDGKDNDGDGKPDCADESCAAERWCRQSAAPERTERGFACGDHVDNDQDGISDCQEPSCADSVYCQKGPEEGLRCRDGADNDGNGRVDCQEATCQTTWYCRKRIYYVPVTPGRPQGFALSMSMGIATPNWRGDASRVCIDESSDGKCDARAGFSPGVGVALKVDLAYMPLSWLGAGIQLFTAATGGSSRGQDESVYSYKYEALALTAHAGAFVRLQVPSWGRFVPSLDLAAGYSYVQYQWWIYNRNTTWHDIDMGEYADRATPEKRVGQLTLAAQPGFDFFIRERQVAVGMRAWLPIWGLKDPSVDSLAVMFTVTYTPSWRERPQIRPEYTASQPASPEPAVAPQPGPAQ